MSRFFCVKPLVWALASGFAFSSPLWAATATLSLSQGAPTCRQPGASQPQQMIRTPKGSGDGPLAGGATRISADKLSGQSQTHVKAEGDVIVERDRQTLNADWIAYDQQTQILQAGDEFVLSDGGNRVSGHKLSYDLAGKQGEAEQARFEAQNQGRRLQGTGARVRMEGESRYRLEHARFNTCDANDESWYIEAASIDADYDQNIGVARQAKLVLKGVPILYTPWVDFPLNGDRKSGLLAPTVKIGSDGFELTTPYYVNLAPNYDLTIKPHLISRRGMQLGADFRYLRPQYSGQASIAWLPQDRASEFNNRTKVDWMHQHRFTDKLTGGIDFHQVSDDDYYRDLMGSSVGSNVHLNRQLWLNHQSSLWGGRLSHYFSVQKHQTLASITGFKDAPYAMLPRVSSQWSRHFNDTYSANVYAQGTYFSHNDKQEGVRLVLNPSVTADFHNSWGFVRPKVGVHARYYDLQSFGNEPKRQVSRVLPTISIDSGMVLERPWRFREQGFVQTLEPRLFYSYIPKRSQNDLPLFDASENSFTYEQLFRENRFSGQDRINAANFITTALQTRLLDDGNGAERLSAGIGQRFYFNKDSVMLDGSVQKNERDRSDILAFARGHLSPNMSVQSNWHYNQNLNTSEAFDVGWRYSPEQGKSVSMRYKFDRNAEIYDDNYGKVRQIDAVVQWPIGRGYYFVGRHNYDLTHSRSLQQVLGMEYRSPCRCWRASVVGQRYVSGLNETKSGVFLQLQLRDLTSVGDDLFEQLRTAVPGYRSLD